MENTKFDDKLATVLNKIIEECFNYAENDSSLTDIFVYISFEWVIYFNVFYKGDDRLYRKHKINNTSITAGKQEILIDRVHSQLNQLKQLFIDSNKEVPTQIKLQYSIPNNNLDTLFSHKHHHNDELFIGDDEVANEWYDELASSCKSR